MKSFGQGLNSKSQMYGLGGRVGTGQKDRGKYTRLAILHEGNGLRM